MNYVEQIVLLYNFERKRLQNVRKALVPLKVKIKTVSKGQFFQPLGYLAGVDGILPSDEKYTGEGFTEEMLVMYGFGSEKIDLLISLLSQCPIGKIELKAVITPSNMYWNGVKLYKEIKSEHDAMIK